MREDLLKNYTIQIAAIALAVITSVSVAYAGEAISDSFEDTFGHDKIPNAFNEAFGGSSGSSHHKAKKAQPQNTQPVQ